jgi:RNA polymerase sigma-70 factor, ECF subfamily
LDSGEEDIRLLSRIQCGETGALAQLYDRYGALMIGVALKILPTRESAEDIVHDVFLEAWRSAESYDAARGTVRNWLLIRLRSRCLDRRRSAHSTRVIAMADLRTVERTEVAEESLEMSPDRAAIRVVLTTLSPEQRQVLELSYFDGLSSAEISERIGVPSGRLR